jgi:mannose-6-phosphate isomerase-like protein (cupin superfamily)
MRTLSAKEVLQMNTTTTTTTQELWFLNTLVTVRVGHDQGRDGISVLESRAPYGDSPPLHVHHTEDETFYVLEGELRIRAGNGDIRIGAGEAALAPMGVLHTYRVESHEGARWLNVTTHGDFERFVRALSRPAEHSELPAPQGPPTPEQADALAVAARQHGIELVGPPLEP